jgi:hypothetical protein
MSELLPFVSQAISTGGTATSISGYDQAASAALATGNYNADVEGIRAQNATNAASANASMVAARTALTQGQIAANYGAAGVDSGGSPMQVMQAAAIQGELSRQLTLYQGTVQAQSDQQQAVLDRYNAQVTATADKTKAESTLLTGAGNLTGPNSLLQSYLNKASGGGGSGAAAAATSLFDAAGTGVL